MVLGPGMQTQISGPWKSAYNADVPVMADDGADMDKSRNSDNKITDMDTSRDSPNFTVSSIAKNLLKRANGYNEPLCHTTNRVLEQKIQELRAEKEGTDQKKCPNVLESDQDIPLDFSVKRRSSFSGSLTDDSQESYSPNTVEYTSCSPNTEYHENTSYPDGKKRSPSPISNEKHIRDEDTTPNQFSTGIHNHLLNNMSGFDGSLSSFAGSNPMQAFMANSLYSDSRSRKSSRPFKAYPKEVLQMPVGFFGLPGMNPQILNQVVEAGSMGNMGQEELMNYYQQQLLQYREKALGTQLEKKSSPSISTKEEVSVRSESKSSHNQQSPSPPSNLSNIHQQPSPISSLSSPAHLSPEIVKHETISSPVSHSMPSSHNSSNNHLNPMNHQTSNNSVSSTSSTFGSLLPSSSSSRKRPRILPEEQKDENYWERRRKNNEAAKRSRDARRAKEDEIALRAALLEQENIKLRVEVAALKTETARLRCMLYTN